MSDLGGNSYPADAPVTDQERTWAMAAHLATLLGSAVPFGNVLAPLVIWLVQRDRSRFVRKHALESLLFQVGLGVAAVVLVMWMMMSMARGGAGILLPILGVLALTVADLLYMVLAAIRANEGKVWEYPITTRFVS